MKHGLFKKRQYIYPNTGLRLSVLCRYSGLERGFGDVMAFFSHFASPTFLNSFKCQRVLCLFLVWVYDSCLVFFDKVLTNVYELKRQESIYLSLCYETRLRIL